MFLKTPSHNKNDNSSFRLVIPFIQETTKVGGIIRFFDLNHQRDRLYFLFIKEQEGLFKI